MQAIRLCWMGLLCALATGAQAGAPLVFDGGTLLDLSRAGRATHDLRDARVVIRDGRIVAAGARQRIALPADANVIDATGSFIVPGLNDVFATVNNQSQANAFLYLGVTGIVGIDDPGGRRGPLFHGASPGPRVYPLDDLLGVDPASGPTPTAAACARWSNAADA